MINMMKRFNRSQVLPAFCGFSLTMKRLRNLKIIPQQKDGEKAGHAGFLIFLLLSLGLREGRLNCGVFTI